MFHTKASIFLLQYALLALQPFSIAVILHTIDPQFASLFPATHIYSFVVLGEIPKTGCLGGALDSINSLRIHTFSLLSLWASVICFTSCPEQPWHGSVHSYSLGARSLLQLLPQLLHRRGWNMVPAGEKNMTKWLYWTCRGLRSCPDKWATHLKVLWYGVHLHNGRLGRGTSWQNIPSLSFPDWSGTQWFTWHSGDVSEAKKPAA